MGDDASEAFGTVVEGDELLSGLVVDDDRLVFHSKVFSPASFAAALRCRSEIFLMARQ
jgi:hypothetical protein